MLNIRNKLVLNFQCFLIKYKLESESESESESEKIKNYSLTINWGSFT